MVFALVRLTWLNTVIFRSFTLLQVALFHSFLWLNNIPLWIYIPSCLSIYLSDYEVLFQYFSCPSLKETPWNSIFIYFGSRVEMHIISAPSCVVGVQMCSQEATFIQVFLCFFHPPSSVSPSPFVRAPSTLDLPIILHFLDSSAKPWYWASSNL